VIFRGLTDSWCLVVIAALRGEVNDGPDIGLFFSFFFRKRLTNVVLNWGISTREGVDVLLICASLHCLCQGLLSRNTHRTRVLYWKCDLDVRYAGFFTSEGVVPVPVWCQAHLKLQSWIYFQIRSSANWACKFVLQAAAAVGWPRQVLSDLYLWSAQHKDNEPKKSVYLDKRKQYNGRQSDEKSTCEGDGASHW
jgi:hypothetical protein